MRVAVFGAGYAGLTVARRLERRLPETAHLVVVDESEVHLVQHELHRVIRRPGLADALTVPLSAVLERAHVHRARVTEVDPERGRATLSTGGDDGEEFALTYDLAAVCLGAETEFHGLQGVREHATPLERLEHARAIRRDALDAAGGHAVVGGGGLSGIQVAGELAALSREEGLDLDVTVLEREDRIAPAFSEAFARAVGRELEARDVSVRTGATVESADADAVHLADGSLPHDALVWTGGIRGPSALGGERRPVSSDLRVGGGTFVVGDAGRVVDEDDRPVPASAQAAVGQARVAASNVRRVVRESEGRDAAFVACEVDLEEYRFDTPGWVVSVGDGAVARVGPVVLSGEPARAAKAVVGAGHLGSVGAIEEATDLVAAELGWPTSEAVDAVALVSEFLDTDELTRYTDPASPGEAEYPLALTAIALADAFGAGEVDATALTRLWDRDYPGSPANLFDRTVLNSVETVGHIATLGYLGSERTRDRERARQQKSETGTGTGDDA